MRSKINFKALFFIMAFCLLFEPRAIAQIQDDELLELSLEELMNLDVVTASKSKENINDAPGIIQVITSSEIERFGAINLLEIIERFTSVVNVGSMIYPQNVTSVRGDLANDFDTHVLLLLNGRPMRESAFGGFNFSIYLSFPISTIERVEMIRGPGSVLYGSNAYSGVINIITKKSEGGVSGSAKLTAGSFGTYEGSGDFNFAKNDFSLSGGFKFYDEEGWDFTAKDILGDTRTVNFYEKNRSFLLSSKYKGFSLNLSQMLSTQRFFAVVVPIWLVFDSNTGQPIPGSEDKQLESSRTILDLGYEHAFSEKFSSEFHTTLNDWWYEYEIGPLAGPPSAKGTDDVLFELTNRYNPDDKLNVLFGGTAYLQTGKIDGLIDKFNNTWYSAYAQVDYRVINPIKLTAGGQFNSIEGLGEDFVPRVGLIGNITEKLGAKVLWGQSFRAPYEVERRANSVGLQVGNPNLKAEKLTNFDFQLFYVGSNFKVNATYFSYRSDNLINASLLNPEDPADRTVILVNTGEALEGSGFSVETSYVPNEKILITGSFSNQSNKTRISGFNGSNIEIKPYTFAPSTMLKLGASYRSQNKAFSIGLFNTYMSKFKSGQSEFIPSVEANKAPNTANLLSANVLLNLPKLFNWSMTEDLMLNFYSTNLLNEKVFIPDFTNQIINSIPGRAGAGYYGSVIFKF